VTSSSERATARAAVFIPVFNGARYLAELLEALVAQEVEGGVDVLVIDSGSGDGSVEIARRFPVRLHQIPNAEFGHGRTRNLAMRMTAAPFVAFLTQDATPAHPRWLAELLAPFADPRVAATLGRQLPRRDSDPTTARTVAEAYGPRATVVQGSIDGLPVFSSVNSCVRRTAWEAVPYRDVRYAEDFHLARDLLAAGFRIAYAPEGAVLHSNEYTLAEYFGRMIDEFGALPPTPAPMLEARLVKRWIAGTAGDLAFALRRSPARFPRDAAWAVVAQAQRLAAAYLRNRHPRLFVRAQARFSLEGRRRSLETIDD
jgi:rhamnosyltransferase